MKEYRIQKTEDFELSGQKGDPAWEKACPVDLVRVGGNATLGTELRALWSDKGVYFRVCCEIQQLHCSGSQDFDDLYEGDVLEFFLQPDARLPVYFEYELSPAGLELPLMVCNTGKEYHGWLPFHYTGERCVKRKVTVCENECVAECMIPFSLMQGTIAEKVVPGTCWRGNFFRIDHSRDEVTRYAWEPACGTQFHDFTNFGSIIFA